MTQSCSDWPVNYLRLCFKAGLYQQTQDHRLPVFPAKEQHVALYLKYIEDSSKSKAAAEEAVHALNWVHNLAGLEFLTQSPQVQTTLEG